jgi:hypothetical protein
LIETSQLIEFPAMPNTFLAPRLLNEDAPHCTNPVACSVWSGFSCANWLLPVRAIRRIRGATTSRQRAHPHFDRIQNVCDIAHNPTRYRTERVDSNDLRALTRTPKIANRFASNLPTSGWLDLSRTRGGRVKPEQFDASKQVLAQLRHQSNRYEERGFQEGKAPFVPALLLLCMVSPDRHRAELITSVRWGDSVSECDFAIDFGYRQFTLD